MKIKILLMPFAITVSISVLIWLVWPTFSNGYDGAKETNAKLKQERLKYSELENKMSNTEKLFSQFSSNSEKDVLFNFIPKNILEEGIIDNVNYIASTSGLSIGKLAITPSKAEAAPTALALDDDDPLADDLDGLAAPSLPSAQKVKVALSFTGNYDSIKKFFDELYKLGRYSDVNSLALSSNVAKSGSADKEASASGILAAEMEIEFNLLADVKITSATMSDPVFLTDRLNTDIFSKIKAAKSRELLKLNISEKGKSNPFLP